MKLQTFFRLLVEAHVQAAGWVRGLKPILAAAAFFYGIGVGFHRWGYQAGLFRRRRLNHFVVSVGNITWGGTGKTPLVEYVARFYLGRGKTPLILARGYGEDESKELAHKLPDAVFGIGKDRFHEAKKALAHRPADVVILDDGFQHWAIERNLDIVVVNVLNPFGNFSLIPGGILREPIQSLRRASLVILNDVNLTSRKAIEGLKVKIRSVKPDVQFVEAYHEPLYFYRPNSRFRVPPDRLRHQRVTAFSAVGTPRSFQLLLNRLEIKTVRHYEFSDHHRFTDAELKEVLRMKELSESDEVVTTEKDFFRCREAVTRILRPLVLKVRLRVLSGEALLHASLEKAISNGHSG